MALSFSATFRTLITKRYPVGKYYSDRCYFESFFSNAHPSIRAAIGQPLQLQVDRIDFSLPLPDAYNPINLYGTCLEYANRYALVNTILQAPCRRTDPALHAREIAAQPPALDPHIAAVERGCFLCGDDHLADDCPKLTAIRSDPFRAGVLRKLLGPAPPSNDRCARPPRRDLAIRQVEFDVPDDEQQADSVDAPSNLPANDHDSDPPAGVPDEATNNDGPDF